MCSSFARNILRICIHNIACAKRVGFGRKAAYGRLRGPLILRRSHLIIYICPYGLCEYIYIPSPTYNHYNNIIYINVCVCRVSLGSE